ncbi:MAG: hypothetical protein ABI222_11180 [Opitutaceae bacterium]
MALVGPTFPPFKMPPLEAELDPASRSVVARLRVLAPVVWMLWTATGVVAGTGYVLGIFANLGDGEVSSWYKAALVVVVICSGVVGCFIGYLNKVGIDWARQVLVVLGQIANKQ